MTLAERKKKLEQARYEFQAAANAFTKYLRPVDRVSNNWLEEFYELYGFLLSEIDRRDIRISSLQEALRFYAYENEWIDYKAYGQMKDGTLARVDSHFDTDMGKKAREALGEELPKMTQAMKAVEMKPGRELDALIAEKVMGARQTVALTPPNTEWIADWGGHSSEIPYYSTDIAAAWEVVEKFPTIENQETRYLGLNDHAFPFILRKVRGGWEAGWEVTYWASFGLTEAETASHAICLAALRAIEGNL